MTQFANTEFKQSSLIHNGELSDPLCDSVNGGLTLVGLVIVFNNQKISI